MVVILGIFTSGRLSSRPRRCILKSLMTTIVRGDGQAPVVQTLDSAIHQINHYPADSVIDFRNTYPLDSDLSGG